ncbi:MAG TPA: energy transducer TonB [Allosphingosinicella sp.]|nr:energy transducer TonB [Allosphingosinicella sp.]
MTGFFRALVLLAAAALLTAQAPPASLRQPIKGWGLDYGDTACTALRTYGSAASPITLAFRPSPSGSVVRLVVVRPGRGPPAHYFNVTTNISGHRAKTTGLRFASARAKQDVIWINLERSDFDALPAAGEIAIRAGGVINERFALPGIGAVLKGLDECNADLRRHWNVGAAGTPLASYAQPVRPLAAYFSDSDYPGQAVFDGASGRSEMMLMIDETGALKDCLIEQTSGIASLDATACAVLIQRARFRPARDPDGRPVRSVLTASVVWRMP